jgi:hypothetical protein
VGMVLPSWRGPLDNYIFPSSRKKEKKEVGIRLSLAIVASLSSVSFRRRKRRITRTSPNVPEELVLTSYEDHLGS